MRYLELKFVSLAFVIVLLSGCDDGLAEHAFNLNGKIKGLRKGKIYLQRSINGTLVSVDSVSMKSQDEFSFKGELVTPEVYWVYIKSKEYFKVPIFMERGNLSIFIDMDSILQSKVTGSKNHQKFVEFKKVLSGFNYRKNIAYVNFLKAKNEGIKNEAQDNMTKIERTKDLYVLNFAFTNKDMAVSPYAIYNYLGKSPKKYLDSIKKSMGAEALESIYGRLITSAGEE